MNWTNAYILHRYAFEDSGLLVKLWTQQQGLVSAVIKGVRKAKSKRSGICQPFVPLQVTLSGRGDVLTVRQLETCRAAIMLSGDALAIGFYLNELLLTFVHPHHVIPDLFAAYEQALLAQQSSVNSVALRQFEMTLMHEMGYDLVLDHDEHGDVLTPESYYLCQPECLPRLTLDTQQGIRGDILQALAQQQWQYHGVMQAAKQLCRTWIAHYSHGKTFQSRQLWKTLHESR
jgi:DNA repair protein RecO (recombination protein O)